MYNAKACKILYIASFNLYGQGRRSAPFFLIESLATSAMMALGNNVNVV